MAGKDIPIELLRQTVHRASKIHFQHSWQFRLEIEGQPSDWDIYCKEISQQPWDIETDQINAGASPVSYPVRSNPVTLSTTVRDNEDGEVWDFFDGLAKKMVNKDGTWNPPVKYVIKVKIYRRLSNGSERLRQEMRMIPLSLGELIETVEETGTVQEFPLTFIEFRAGG
ncbi:MAG: hypothetical protein OIF57_06760 [Marinobacterium sp.]|nr:hypothetical protein [Marinobacterium sp.]